MKLDGPGTNEGQMQYANWPGIIALQQRDITIVIFWSKRQQSLEFK